MHERVPPRLLAAARAALLLALLALPAFAVAAHAEAADSGPTQGQAELAKQPLTIVGADGRRHAFTVEMAATPEQQETGLMFRTAVAPDSGMLFDWGTSRRSEMWMKNTLVPLDMLFIAQDGTVTHIAENTVPRSLAVIDGRAPVRATLELAGGTAERLGLRVGDRVEGAGFPVPRQDPPH